MRTKEAVKSAFERRYWIVRVGLACIRASRTQRRNVNSTRLWNWIDHQNDCEVLFAVHRFHFSDRYQDTSCGRCHLFAYHPELADTTTNELLRHEYLLNDGWPDSTGGGSET